MIAELLELLCGSAQCGEDFFGSPCSFLIYGVMIKAVCVSVFALTDATQPQHVKLRSPFVSMTKYFGCVESVAAVAVMFFDLKGSLAYISLADGLLSVLLFWVMFDIFKALTPHRRLFGFAFFTLFSLLVLTMIFVVPQLKSLSTLSTFEKNLLVSAITRIVCFVVILGGLLLTLVYDPCNQLNYEGGDMDNMRESSMLRISLLGMNKDYTSVATSENENEDLSKASTVERQSYYSILFFSRMSHVFDIVANRPLSMDDVPPLPHKYSCSRNSKQFFIALIRNDMNILKTIKMLYLHEYLFTGILILISSLTSFIGPLMLDKLVRAASALADSNDSDDSRARQWALVYSNIAILFLSKVVSAFSVSHYNYACQRISIGLSAAIKGSLYQKTLLLSSQSRQAHTTGSITNLYTVDADRVVNVTIALHNFWALPLQIIIAMVLLYYVVSWAMLAGLGAIIIVLALNKVIATKTKTTTDSLMAAKDSRMKNISEIFKSLLTIKLNSWEVKFQSKVLASRTEELKLVWIILMLYSLNIFLLWMAPNVVAVATIAVYTKGLGEDVTTARIFTALALFRLLRSLLRALPDYISQFFQATVSLERLEKYFRLEEKNELCVELLQEVEVSVSANKCGAISFENCIYQWQKGTEDNEEGSVEMRVSQAIDFVPKVENKLMKLHIHHLTIPATRFVVVKGPVGSGKSSFCHAILGEMPTCRCPDDMVSRFRCTGRIAFAGQQAWIQSGSLRDNILFGLPFEKEKYDRVVDACCLIQDFAELPDGDMTFIGQKGINLSGGQKSRVSLARAVYLDADIYILDDIFAALDAIVGKIVFEKVVLELLAGKTRVVVTHKEDIINHPSVMCTLEISPEGELTERMNSSFKDMSPTSGIGQFIKIRSVVDVPYVDSFQESFEAPIDKDGVDEDDDAHDLLCMDYSYSGKKTGKSKQGLDVDEESSSGKIDVSVFKGYMAAAGGMTAILLLFFVQTLWQLLSIASDVFITEWAKETDYEQQRHIDRNIAIYSALALGSGFLVLARTITISFLGFAAAKNLFENMLNSLLYAPMWWHDRNPTGRILNRFSDDQDKVDNYVAMSVGSIFATCFSTCGSLITVLVITRYLGLIVLPIAYIYFGLMSKYLTVGREVQRLQSMSKSPFLSLMSESVDGLVQLRSFGVAAVKRCILRNESLVDKYCQSTFVMAFGNSWFTLRIQLLSAFFVLAISGVLFVGAFSAHSFISPSLIALALSYSLYISDDLMFLVIIWAWFEQGMVSPERILQYIDLPAEGTSNQLELFREDDNSNDDHHNRSGGITLPTGTWPSQGIIEFRGVWFRYQPIENTFDKYQARNSQGDDIGAGCVLKNLNFKTAHKEKIGIVGRTGAGKSSLTMCLFRISEIARGAVYIDGVDVSTLSLACLRSAIEIVPQNPVVFKGSLRNYIDPFEEYSDDQIWASLKKARLVSMVEKMGSANGNGLMVDIAENGENMSVGQRQMLVMSRALLREAKILVMDEATAAMDIESDELLQEVLREEFKDTTVLTIAHRIETIIDSDRVIVMSEGTMIEFDKPGVLIRKVDSVFHKLATDAGIDISKVP